MKTYLGSEAVATRAAALARDILLTVRFGCAPEVDGFSLVGSGKSRAALLAGGVVYKALHHEAFYSEAASKEAELFESMESAGLPWTPDFWPYPEHNVIAMPLYAPADLDTYQGSAARAWAEEWLHHARPDNFGQREDGSLVLLDGDQVRRLITYEQTGNFLSGRRPGGGLGRGLLVF